MTDGSGELLLPMALPEQPAPLGFEVDADEVPCRFCRTLVPHDDPWGLCDECLDAAEWDD